MDSFHDDNFGEWHDMDDEDMVAFYHKTQATNVEKICVDCGQKVMIQPDYECCNSCANLRERGV